jgi:F-type H+-transporting ATPase subunit alpha
LALAQYRELAAFAQFASDLDEVTRKQLNKGQRFTEVMKQKQYSPLTIAEIAISLFAVDNGFVDDIDLKKVVNFEHELHAYFRQNYQELLNNINQNPDYNDQVASQLRDVLTQFKQTQTW